MGTSLHFPPPRDSVSCAFTPCSVPSMHCFSGIPSGYKVQGRRCPSSMTSGAPFRPKRARNSRISGILKQKIQTLLSFPPVSATSYSSSIYFLCFSFHLRPHILYHFEPHVCQALSFTNRFLLEDTPPVNECFYSRLSDQESETRNSQWPDENHRPVGDRRLATPKRFLLHYH